VQPVPTEGKPAAQPVAEAPKTEAAKPLAEKPAEKPGEKPADTKAEKPKAVVAPEKYEFTTPKGLPDGQKLDDAVIADLSSVAKELNLSQEQAQKLIDKVWPTMHRRGLESAKEVHETWVQEIRTHKTLGGEKLVESQKVAQSAINFFDKEGKLGGLLTGPLRLGDNPAFFEFAHAVGQAMKNDRFVGSDRAPVSGASDDAALAQRLYKTT
jgi:hypothetical protein